MFSLKQFRDCLTSRLGFKNHQINDGNGHGVAAIAEGVDDRAVFLASTDAGNSYAAFKHDDAVTLNGAAIDRYRALSLLMPGGPAAYCVIEARGNLHLYPAERGDEIRGKMEDWDAVGDAEDIARKLKAEIWECSAQWAKRTDSDLSSFLRLMKGCWQDIRGVEDEGNGWVFDELTRFLCIKVHEDRKESGSFTRAKLRSYREQNKQMGENAARRFINMLFDDLKTCYPKVFPDENECVSCRAETVEGVMARLEGTKLSDPQGDVLGRACAIMLSDTFSKRGLGQFSTPREIVAFMLDLAYGKPTDEKTGIWLSLMRDPEDINMRLIGAGNCRRDS